MTDVLYHLIMILPVPLEMVFDAVMWNQGLDDKPWSTWIVRPILWIGCFCAIYFTNDYLAWWQIAPLMVAWFGLLFNYLINWLLGNPFFHLGNNWFDRQLARIHDFPRLWGQIIIVITFECIYFYF